MTESIALTERPTVSSIVRPVMTPTGMIEAHREVSDLIAKALEAGKDYGVIPGTGSKPTLLKPGAERLVKAFGCVARYHIIETERDHNFPVQWSKRKKAWRNQFKGDKAFSWTEETGTSLGLYRYVVRCELVRLDASEVVGDGLGSCSTMESKYIDRPRDSENTVLKMSCKRALVAASLNAFGLSDRFTQDVEDVSGEVEPPPPEQQPDRVPPTEKQMEYVQKLLKSSVWTPEEVATYQKQIEAMLEPDVLNGAEQMHDLIEMVVPMFNARKAARNAAQKAEKEKQAV